MKRTLYNTTKPSYYQYKKRHLKYDNAETMISKQDFEELILQECVYCGFKPNGVDSWNSLDRLDNNKGYTKNNVYPCCKHCNYAKGSLPFNLFKEWVSNLTKFYVNKKGIWSE